MSYSELWDCFVEVKESWVENRLIVESYLEVVKFRAEIEKSYSKKLDKLCTYPFFRLGKNTLVPVIEKFKSFFMTKLLGSKHFITSAQNDIIQPLRELLAAQDIKIKEQIEAGRKLDHDKKKINKAYEQSKEKYWKSCRDTLLNQKNKADYLAKEEAAFDVYCRQLDTVNRFNVIYTEEMGKDLLVFQACEEERLKHLRESLRKLLDAETELSNSVSNELESIPLVISMKAINVFNPITEIFKFIDDTKTGESAKIIAFDPSPYGTTYKVPDQKITLEDSALLKINIKCWEGIALSEDEYKFLKDIIHKPEVRKSFIYFLNERRIKSHFMMPALGFSIMSKLMLDLLDSISQDLDEHSAKMVIVLAQTFYCDTIGVKQYLIALLIEHQLWKGTEIWMKMIEDGIHKEMDNYAQFCADESSEEHRDRMGAIIFSQLSSYIHIMKTFQIDKEFITGIVDNLKEKFKIADSGSIYELIEIN